MKKFNLLLLAALIIVLSLKLKAHDNTDSSRVKITTPYGEMVAVLYNETPRHRDNFLMLADSGFYDSTLFHRVMNNFMIQGGDPDSKGAPIGVTLGNGGPGYTLPAEIIPGFIHKKGVLAAARNPDNINPEFRSNGSQFYIVEGNKLDSNQLAAIHQHRINKLKQQAYQDFFRDTANKAYKNRLVRFQETRDQAKIQQIYSEIDPIIEKMLPDMKGYVSYEDNDFEMYKNVGGTPHLDGSYTVFGELISGYDVLDAISNVITDPNTNRPVEDIWMTIETLDKDQD